MKIVTPRTDDEKEALLRGRVDAARINDVIAKPDTKAYSEYLRLVSAQALGEPDQDPNDAYRKDEERLRQVVRALEAYQFKHPDEDLETGLIYLSEKWPIACQPDAVAAGVGITVSVHGLRARTPSEGLRLYHDAVYRGITEDQRRKAWAMMPLTHTVGWILTDYYEDAETGVRKLYEHEPIKIDRVRAEQLLDELIQFSAKTRFRAKNEAAA